MSNLQQRILSGLVMAAAFLAAVALGGWVFAALMALVSLVIWSEWTNIALSEADDRTMLTGYVALLLMAIAAIFLQGAYQLIVLLILFAVSIGLMLSWSGGGMSSLGMVYAAGFFVSMDFLRNGAGDHNGLYAILFLCAAVWATDIGAYFAGRAIGGPKLAPAISPNKTMSGAIGGIVCAILAAGLIANFFGAAQLTVYFFLAAMLSVISQGGDLFESWLKRHAGVKDSGTIISGHGGVMDRVDGLVFAAISLSVVTAISSTLFAQAAPITN